jgi:hypothetical protein
MYVCVCVYIYILSVVDQAMLVVEGEAGMIQECEIDASLLQVCMYKYMHGCKICCKYSKICMCVYIHVYICIYTYIYIHI